MREHKEIGSKPVSYYYLKDKNLIIGTTMRAASSSMHTVLEKRSTITQKRVMQLREQGMPVVIWLRQPYARLASAYSLFKKNRSINEFIHHVTHVRNTHWLPQTTVHSYNNQFLPTKVIPFSKLNDTWEELIGVPLPHLKESNRDMWGKLLEDVSTDSLCLLQVYYRSDLDLYRKINVYNKNQT